MKRGLVFAKYGDLAASTRQRFVQAVPYLAGQDIALEIAPLFDNAYLSLLFNKGKRHRLSIVKAYIRRAFALLRCKQYDFIFVQYELFPYLPGWFESLLRYTDKPVFYDLDDAIFHQYDSHPNTHIRKLLGNKLVPLLKRADIAFCGNAYLQAYVAQHCAHTEIIPTTLDVTQFAPPTQKMVNHPPVLGWIGSPSTWDYCAPLLDMLSNFTNTLQMSALIIGAGHKAAPRTNFEFADWVEQNEVFDIQRMDIGIMPIPDEPWARGKCGYKLIQYMACGVPVIASPVGVNRDIVQHGINGFLASTEEEWRSAITQLLQDKALRERMGAAGRKTVEERFSIQIHGPRVAHAISERLRLFAEPTLEHQQVP
jgi:glycosyltransferase involved in cell wall biosynthesis